MNTCYPTWHEEYWNKNILKCFQFEDEIYGARAGWIDFQSSLKLAEYTQHIHYQCKLWENNNFIECHLNKRNDIKARAKVEQDTFYIKNWVLCYRNIMNFNFKLAMLHILKRLSSISIYLWQLLLLIFYFGEMVDKKMILFSMFVFRLKLKFENVKY